MLCMAERALPDRVHPYELRFLVGPSSAHVCNMSALPSVAQAAPQQACADTTPILPLACEFYPIHSIGIHHPSLHRYSLDREHQAIIRCELRERLPPPCSSTCSQRSIGHIILHSAQYAISHIVRLRRCHQYIRNSNCLRLTPARYFSLSVNSLSLERTSLRGGAG